MDINFKSKYCQAWLSRKITEERTKKEKEKEQLEAERKVNAKLIYMLSPKRNTTSGSKSDA